MSEPDININGTPLSIGQAMSLRVAVTSYFEEMAAPDALGNDERGRRMTELYRLRLGEVLRLILPTTKEDADGNAG